MRWIMLASLLVTSGESLSMIARELQLRLYHSILGVAVFLLPAAGLMCLGLAALSWQRRSRSPTHSPSQAHADSLRGR